MTTKNKYTQQQIDQFLYLYMIIFESKLNAIYYLFKKEKKTKNE